MRKFLNYICLILIFTMMLSTSVAFATNTGSGGGGGSAMNGQVGGRARVSAVFGLNSYLTGDIAEVSLYITDRDFGEADGDALSIGSFEINIEYDSSKLIPYCNGAEVTEGGKAAGEINSSLGLTEDDKREIVTASKHPDYLESGKELIVCYFESSNGVAFDENGDILVGKCYFKVKAESGEVGLSLRNASLYKPYSGDKNDVEAAKIGIYKTYGGSAVIAKETDVICSDAEYVSESGKVEAEVTVRVKQNAYLVAQLYDTTNDIMRGIQVIPIVYDVGKAEYTQPLTFTNVKGNTDLVIRYYLWNSMSEMKPLIEIKQVGVGEV